MRKSTTFVLGQLLQDKDPKRSQRVMEAMLKMDKLDIKKLQRLFSGSSPAVVP